tara:strand:- start:15 stop:599 length:585 start_codon:yes stop_codon:yes gene_type:complete
MNKIFFLFGIIISLAFSCNDYDLPKQKAFLRIEFKEPQYTKYKDINSLTDFYYNSSGAKINSNDFKNFSLLYADLNLSVDLSINSINSINDLKNNLLDFSLILDTHSKKSNGVFLREYEDENKMVFGKLYEIKGNVASPIQFYLTDSISNFISGSLNLKSKSKYDSIYPSIQYVKNDILVLFESINWKYNNETK